MIYSDLPYGVLELVKTWWDQRHSDDEMDLFFKQLAIINRASTHIIALHCWFRDTGRVGTYMERHGYTDVHPVFCYKPRQNQRGTGCFISSVDTILLGYKPSRAACNLRFASPNPLLRHNLLFVPNVTKRLQDSDGKDINPTQKHITISQRLGQIACAPGSKALVIGAGSGSELIGLHLAGMHVTGIEKDARQFLACSSRLLDFTVNPDDVLSENKRDLDLLSSLNNVASNYTTKLVVGEAKSENIPLPASPIVISEEAKLANSSGKNCAVCGETTVDQDVECAAAACKGQPKHADCLVMCPKSGETGCNLLFCDADCANDHTCVS